MIFRFEDYDNAEYAWTQLQDFVVAPYFHCDIWIDFIGYQDNTYIIVEFSLSPKSQELVISNLLAIINNCGGFRVIGGLSKLHNASLSYRNYIQQKGICRMQLRYEPGLWIPIKYKREAGRLV